MSRIESYFKGATAIGTSEVVGVLDATRNYQMIVEGTGAVSATATVYGSTQKDGPWVPMITFSASGTTQASDHGETYRLWRYTRADLTAISGTGAKVTLNVEG